jgi:hypothetical protein
MPLARRGKAFRPIEGNTGTKAGTSFVSNEGTTYWLAAFNWSNGAAANLSIDLARAGLDTTKSYAVRDLWTGAKSTAKGTLAVSLPKMTSTILELVPAP